MSSRTIYGWVLQAYASDAVPSNWRLYFNRPSVSHHGTWLPTTYHAPTWPTEAEALAAARQLGMLPGTYTAVELVPGVGGFDGTDEASR